MNNKVLQLRPGTMHLRHGIRWNRFEKEMKERIESGIPINSIDIIEAIELFLNIYFGFLVREEKAIDRSITERKITGSTKPNISELNNVRNRFIHVDYEESKIMNMLGEKVTVPGSLAYIQNVLLDLNWVLENQMKISNKDFEGIKNMVQLILILIEKCNDFAIIDFSKEIAPQDASL